MSIFFPIPFPFCPFSCNDPKRSRTRSPIYLYICITKCEETQKTEITCSTELKTAYKLKYYLTLRTNWSTTWHCVPTEVLPVTAYKLKYYLTLCTNWRTTWHCVQTEVLPVTAYKLKYNLTLSTNWSTTWHWVQTDVLDELGWFIFSSSYFIKFVKYDSVDLNIQYIATITIMILSEKGKIIDQ